MPEFEIEYQELWRGGGTATTTIEAPSEMKARSQLEEKYGGYAKVKKVREIKVREEKLKEQYEEYQKARMEEMAEEREWKRPSAEEPTPTEEPTETEERKWRRPSEEDEEGQEDDLGSGGYRRGC